MGTMTPALGPNLEPAQKKLTLQSNYLKFDEGDNDFAQQYLFYFLFCIFSLIPGS